MLIETRRDIDAPPAAVWKVFGEGFADIADWATVIRASQIDRPLAVGAVRTCELEAGPITEALTDFNPKKHSLTYAVRSGLPGMVSSAENRWTIEALDGGRSRVTSRVTMDLAWWAMVMTPMVRGRFIATLQSLMEQLDAHVVATSVDEPGDATPAAVAP